MAQAKKKTATKTAKKTQARAARSTATKKTCAKKNGLTNAERFHVCLITGMSMVAIILLCADVAMLAV